MAAYQINDPDGFAAKVTGFTDGEGCFNLKYINTHLKPSPQGRFEINLRADDYMIFKIRDFFRCGHIYRRAARPTPGRENDRPKHDYVVSKISDLVDIIVPHFDRYVLESKKERDFAIWREAVLLMRDVSRRPRRMNGLGGGSRPTWTDAELGQFESLRLALKAVRHFDSDITAVNMVAPGPPDFVQRMFFD